MTLTPQQITATVMALSTLLVAAHAMGELLARLRQPRVIGEIIGGILLGPTLLERAWPEVHAALFRADGVTDPILGAVYTLGLLLLMFCSGVEVRPRFRQGEGRTIAAITVAGTLAPFAAGVLALRTADLGRFQGPAQSDTAFLLVFASAVAVTSIPVISRIFLDLGLLETPFARIVLTAAVLEDVALYVVIAVALGLAAGGPEVSSGLPGLLHLEAGSAPMLAYHVAATLAFLGLALAAGPGCVRALARVRWNLVHRSSPVAFQLLWLLAVTALCLFLGIPPLFGAFVAGIAVGRDPDDPDRAREAIKRFAFAFFIPIYFALVGMRLDLVRHLPFAFFAAFLLFACVVKAASVWTGARLAGERSSAAWNLAIAMNARGGPGIVLASVALDAGIITLELHNVLVMLALVTSLAAGSWLGHEVRSGRSLR